MRNLAELVSDQTIRKAIEWLNAADLILSIAAAVLLTGYLIRERERLRGMRQRIFSSPFMGEAYDLAVALNVLLIGKILRAETVWEWRWFGGELDQWRVLLSVIIIELGVLCTIRILAPSNYNAYFITVIILSLVFATMSIYV